MPISALARWERVLPRSLATPYSVTTQSTSFLLVVTTAPGESSAQIRLTVPPLAVEGKAIKLFPPSDATAPRTKSACPPVPDRCLVPADSAHT